MGFGSSRTAHALLLGLLALGFSACRAFDPYLVHDGGRAQPDASPAHDAGPPEPDAGVDSGPACPLRHPPPRPNLPDGPDGPELFFVLHDLTFDQRGDAWQSIGYDLDGLCSLAPDPMVECLPPDPTSVPEIDGDNGIDNALGHNLLSLLLFAVPALGNISHTMEEGLDVVTVRVQRWDGRADDPHVQAIVSQAVLGTPSLPDGGMPDIVFPPDGGFDYSVDGGPPPFPNWDGNDWWWLRSDGYLGDDLSQPRLLDDNAYVTGNVLVVHLPDRFPIIFSGSVHGIRIRMTDGVATGRISADHRTFDDVLIAGRLPTVDLLDTLGSAGICMGSDDYQRIYRITQLAADVRARPGSGGPGVSCDAISLGLGAQGVTGHLAGISDVFGFPNACASMDGGAGDGALPDAGVPDGG